MDIQHWKSILPEDFSPESRVWIYQSSRAFTEKESDKIGNLLSEYCTQWISHNRPVKGWVKLLFNQFIIFISDDTQDKLCGSAIDNSIRFVKEIEREFNVGLLDRMMLAFLADDEIKIFPVNKVHTALEKGFINPDTCYFNNSVTTKDSLENNWIIPLKNSWIGKKYVQDTLK
ncbi:MAG: hypothetical protein ACRDE2_02610 [Chitinophagaceae bacterium]